MTRLEEPRPERQRHTQKSLNTQNHLARLGHNQTWGLRGISGRSGVLLSDPRMANGMNRQGRQGRKGHITDLDVPGKRPEFLINVRPQTRMSVGDAMKTALWSAHLER